MTSLGSGRRGPSWMGLALTMGALLISGPSAWAFGDGPEGVAVGKFGHHGRRNLGSGTLGYGGDRTYPGFQGFGLAYHPGYGYGGYALGVGADGGYPCYGGPGYPHPAPPLRRLGRLLPYSYYGGRDGGSHYFDAVGPLVVDPPVVSQGIDLRNPVPSGDYGPFTGALPYPASYFAPYSAAAAGTGSSDGPTAPANPTRPTGPDPRPLKVPIGRTIPRGRIEPRSAGLPICTGCKTSLYPGRRLRRCKDARPRDSVRASNDSNRSNSSPSAASTVPLAVVSSAPSATVIPQTSRLERLILQRITNPTPTNAQLIPPFQQVRVQTRTPLTGSVYNVLSVSVRNSTIPDLRRERRVPGQALRGDPRQSPSSPGRRSGSRGR